MINPEVTLLKFNQESEKLEYPKYWVAKFKTQQDVIIKTASIFLDDCQLKTKEIFSTNPFLLDEVTYIQIELRNV